MEMYVPKLRFKRFSNSWKKVTIGELYDFKNGLNKEKSAFGKGTPIINYTDVFKNRHINYSNIKGKVTLSKAEIDRFNVKKGDIFFTRTSETIDEIGYAAALLEDIEDGVFSGFLLRARPKSDKIEGAFSGYCFMSPKVRKSICSKSSITTRALTSGPNLSSVEFHIPSIEEQTKIADFLSVIDSRITIQSAKVDSLTELKKGIMQKIFSQEIRFKREDGGEYPDWDEKRLGDIFSYKNGTSNEQFVVDDGEYYLISLNSIDIDGNFKNIHKKVNRANEFLEKDDLIMILSDVAHGNFLGLSAIIPEDNKYVLNQRVGLLRRKARDNIKFCRYIINSNQKKFKLLGQGSSQQNLSKDDILQSIFSFPVLEEQEKIADFLSIIDSKIDIETQILSTLQTLKKGLLQQMFV